MAAIRSKGNRSTELRLISVFRRNKIVGWRRGYPIFGRPDFVFPKAKVAIFVDGCFWHGCKRCFRMPTSNIEFWTAKIERNRKRDRRVLLQLKKDGWIVMRISECLFKNEVLVLRKLAQAIKILNAKAA
jgi:DNA mismatch endonuclease (patch repair protein)